MTSMGRIEFGRLTQAWKGEAADFTPLLAERLDEIGTAIGINLVAIGRTEVRTAGGRRIDIVAEGDDGASFVIENQYGTSDHDHLTRGLAYAVAPPRARGLIVVAEHHRDEFRAVAEYLNELADLDPEKGIQVWLVEARAIRIGSSPWAPLFDSIVSPNNFTATVGAAKRQEKVALADLYWERFTDPALRSIVESIVDQWRALGNGVWFNRDGHATLTARAPVTGGFGPRSVVALYPDGRVGVSFGSYAGNNSGHEVAALTTKDFRIRANALFGFEGKHQSPKTSPGWVTAERSEALMTFAREVAGEYKSEVERLSISTDASSSTYSPSGEI